MSTNTGDDLLYFVRWDDWSNTISVRIKEDGSARLIQVDGGTLSTLDSTTVTDTVDTWYDVRVLADDDEVTVWRGERSGAMEEILSTTSATQTTTGRGAGFYTTANAEYNFDNIQLIGDSLESETTYEYNDANELTTMTIPDGSDVDFEYDLWGRMTKKELGTTYEATYGYRYGDFLIDVTSDWPGEQDVDYDYGADGKRRERTVDSTTTKYNWSGLAVINEESISGSLTRSYSGSTAAHVDGSDPSTGDYYYYFHDLLGSPLSIRSQSKVLTSAQEFTPFGQHYARVSGKAPRGFTGHQLDDASGLYYAAFRYYNPGSGRWMVRDPLGLIDGTNMYAYVMNNSVSLYDPLGLLIEDLPDIAGGFCRGAADGAMQLADTMIPFVNPFGGRYDPNAPGMREGAIAANIADIANPLGGGKIKGGGRALGMVLPKVKTEMHHTVPREILKKLPKKSP